MLIPGFTGEWNWHELSKHLDVSDYYTSTWLDSYSDDDDRFSGLLPWEEDAILNDRSIITPIEVIRSNPRRGWHVYGLTRNPGMMVDDLLYLPGIRGLIDWEEVSEVVSMEDVMSHPMMPWSRGAMSRNPRVTMEMVLDNE